MKLVILYFSGTGNTDYVARYLAGSLARVPLETELVSVERQPAGALPDFDAVALGFPVYACDSPDIVQRYIEGLAPGDGRGAYVFCTKGAIAGNAVGRNLRRMAARGYVPLGGASVGMPGSDGLAFVGKRSWMARSALGKDFDHLEAVGRLASRIARELSAIGDSSGAEAFRRPLPLSFANTLLDWPWRAAYEAFAGYIRNRLRADDGCTACGLCTRVCPVSTIELVDGRPRFGGACALCMRCIHACPEEAIQIGNATVGKFRWRGPKGEFRPLALRPAIDGDNGRLLWS